MKRNRIAALLLALLLPLTACASVGDAAQSAIQDTDATEPPAEQVAQQTEKPAENESGMPYAPSLFKDTALDLAQYEGKAVWVNFFTSWCGYCMEEMPNLKKIADEYADELVVVLVHVWWNEDDRATAQVIQTYGLDNLPLVEDSDQAIANTLGISGVPTSLFVQKDGYLLGTTNAISYEQMTQVMGMLGLEKADE